MKEFTPQTSEEINLHERGGLTPAHWQEVIRMIGKRSLDAGYEKSLYERFKRSIKDEYTNPHNPIPSKIIAYANKVISGEFPDTGFHHRQYLGRRHWKGISSLDTTDIVKEPRRFPPWPKVSQVTNQEAHVAKLFAMSEMSTTFTLNDYTYVLITKLMTTDLPQFYITKDGEYMDSHDKIFWSRDSWMISYSYDDRDPDPPVRPGIADEASLSYIWLMNSQEAEGDMVHLSPEELSNRLIALGKKEPELVQNRFRAFTRSRSRNADYFVINRACRDSKNFGIPEKEV